MGNIFNEYKFKKKKKKKFIPITKWIGPNIMASFLPAKPNRDLSAANGTVLNQAHPDRDQISLMKLCSKYYNFIWLKKLGFFLL